MFFISFFCSVAMKIKFSLRIQSVLYKFLGMTYEYDMLYISNRSIVESPTKFIAFKNRFFEYVKAFKKYLKFREKTKKINHREITETIIDQLNKISEQFEDSKLNLNNKLNLINYEISELRLAINSIQNQILQ